MTKQDAIIELRNMQQECLKKYDETTDECTKSSYFGYARGLEIACYVIDKIKED